MRVCLGLDSAAVNADDDVGEWIGVIVALQLLQELRLKAGGCHLPIRGLELVSCEKLPEVFHDGFLKFSCGHVAFTTLSISLRMLSMRLL